MTNHNQPPRDTFGMRMAARLGHIASHLVPERTKRRVQAKFAHLQATGEYPNERQHPAFADRQLTRPEIAETSLAMLRSTFHPVQDLQRYTAFVQQRHPQANLQWYRQEYIRGKNVLLQQLLSPIIVTENHSVPQQNAGEHVVCSNGCANPVPVHSMRLVGAQRPEDLSLRMTAEQPEPSVVIADSPKGAIHEATLTSVGIHHLSLHSWSDEAMRAATTLSGFEQFFSHETLRVMDHPAFLPPLPPQQ